MTSTVISRQQSPEHLVHEENSFLDCLTPPREWIEATAKMVRNFLGSEDTFDSTWFKHCFNHHILNAKNTKWAKKVTEEEVLLSQNVKPTCQSPNDQIRKIILV